MNNLWLRQCIKQRIWALGGLESWNMRSTECIVCCSCSLVQYFFELNRRTEGSQNLVISPVNYHLVGFSVI
jgi:hypothetical protein